MNGDDINIIVEQWTNMFSLIHSLFSFNANGKKSLAYHRASFWNNLESEVKKYLHYLYINIDFGIFLFLCYFSISLVLSYQ